MSYPVEGLERLAEGMRARERTVAGGYPVVMVHGFVVSGEYFGPTIDLLPAGLSVYCPDLPGFGTSFRPERALTVPRLAAALTAWMERRIGRPAAVVANSFGCQIAADAAMRRPDLVEQLVLVSPALDPGTRSLRRLLPALAREASTQSPALQRMLLRHYLSTSPRRVVATLRHARWDRMEDKLPHVPAPALVVWGTADPLISRRWAETAANLLPEGTLRVVEGAPHAMNFEAPDLLVPALAGFLAPQAVGV